MMDTTPHSEHELSARPDATQALASSESDSAISIQHISAANSSADIDFMDQSFEMARHFLQHLSDAGESHAPHVGRPSPLGINDEVIRSAILGSNSLEQAIGRAVVLADQMCRGSIDEPNAGDVFLGAQPEDHPFLRVSVADAVPDFGDHSRYRTRAARRLIGVFGSPQRS